MSEKISTFHDNMFENLSPVERRLLVEKLFIKPRTSSADTLLKYAGTWSGEDFQACLEDTLLSRGDAQF